MLAVADADAWVAGLGRSLRAEPGFVGLWIHGSATTRDWVAGVSDIDLLVAWNRRPDAAARDRLTDLLQQALDVAPVETDIFVVTIAAIRHPARTPRYELCAVRHPRDGPPRVEGPGKDAGLLFDFESARVHGVTVVGPDAKAVFGAPPRAWLLDAADDELARWEGYSFFRRPDMAVLLAARVSLLAQEDRLASKLEAGAWAQSHWPQSAALDTAIARQSGHLHAVTDEGDARALIARTRDEVRARRSP